MTLSSTLIYKLMIENQRNPTVIYTDQNVVYTTDILFPSVSIVPGLILKTPLQVGIDYFAIKEKLINHQINLENLTMTELKRLQIASLISRDGFISNNFNITIPTEDFIERMRVDFPTMWWFHKEKGIQNRGKKNSRNTVHFVEGKWSDDIGLNFTEVLCPTGFCYTFNLPDNRSELLNIEILSKDFHYKNFIRTIFRGSTNADPNLRLNPPVKGPKDGKPLNLKFWRRYTYVGNGSVAMRMVMDRNISILMDEGRTINQLPEGFEILEDTVPKSNVRGYPLTIHSPFEIITTQHLKYFTPSDNNYKMKLMITPQLKTFDDSLREMSVDDRLCYLNNERSLKFFNIYNRINCEHECLANLTLKSCDCVQFFMVREPKTRICGVSDEKCFRPFENNFQINKDSCKCHDPCERIEYDVQAHISKFYNKVKSEVPAVDINFDVDKALPQSRRNQQTFTNLFSLIGGFLGLFAGFSVLSGFEVIDCFLVAPILDRLRRVSRRVHPINAERKPIAVIRAYCCQFMQDSSIHGFNHIGNSQKIIIERIIWLLLFILAMIGSYLMVTQVYKSLQLNQIMMTMEGRATQVDEFPFPAVTFIEPVKMASICISKVYFTLKRWREQNWYGSLHTDVIMQLVQRDFPQCNTIYNHIYGMVCNDEFEGGPMVNYNFDYKHPSQFVEFLNANVSGRESWSEHHKTTWNSITKPKFAETLTEHGFGYTFNMIEDEKLLDFENISPDFHYGYQGTSTNQSYPWSTSNNDQNGLSIDLSHNFPRSGYEHGFECGNSYFAIHGHNELPIKIVLNNINFENAYDVVIKPEITKADDDLNFLNVDERKCYFENERKLKYFKIYTQNNCEVECLSHIAYKNCHCVPFYYVRNKTMKICTLRLYNNCIKPKVDKLMLETMNHLYDTHGVCKCYSLCNSITYNYKINEKFNKSMINSKRWNLIETTLAFRYQDGEHFALLRYQPFKLVDFLSYVGGILGLFGGISVLSIVEVFYYFTLRIFSNVARYFRTN